MGRVPGRGGKGSLRRRERWELESLKPMDRGQLKGEQTGFFAEAMSGYLSKRWHSTRSRSVARYDIAILHDPNEKMPPSDDDALRRFIEAGRKLGCDVDLITKKDYNRLAEYDALFIRETTNIDHHTYRFAKKADAEGMAVIDDPESIVKCTNKVYLTEVLINNKVPVPRSLLVRKGEPVDLEGAVGWPAGWKHPGGSLSCGAARAEGGARAPGGACSPRASPGEKGGPRSAISRHSSSSLPRRGWRLPSIRRGKHVAPRNCGPWASATADDTVLPS